MLQVVLALALALASPSTPSGSAVEGAATRSGPWRSLTVQALARALPSETIRSTALLRRVDGEGLALVTGCSIVGPIRTVREREVLFADGGLRLMLTEEVLGERRRLVWRELRAHGARTWVAEWGPSGARATGYGWRRPVHEPLAGHGAAAGPVVGPLELEAALREGRHDDGAALFVVDPSAGRVVRVTVGVAPGCLEARRGDGTLLVAIEDGLPRFHDGTPAAISIPEDAAARHRQRWLVESRPAHEVVLAKIRAAR